MPTDMRLASLMMGSPHAAMVESSWEISRRAPSENDFAANLNRSIAGPLAEHASGCRLGPPTSAQQSFLIPV